jgi:hypothetical protein
MASGPDVVQRVLEAFVALFPEAKDSDHLASSLSPLERTSAAEAFRDAVTEVGAFDGRLAHCVGCCVHAFWSLASHSADPLSTEYKNALHELCFLIKQSIDNGKWPSKGGILTSMAIEGIHHEIDIRNSDYSSVAVPTSLSEHRVKGLLLELFKSYCHLLEDVCGITGWWVGEGDQMSPLGFAAWFNEPDVCSFLIEKGAPFFLPKEAPVRSPVIDAFNFGHVEVVRRFLEAGLDATARFQVGTDKKPLPEASQIPLLNYLFRYPALLDEQSAPKEVMHRRQQIIKSLLERRPDIASLRRILQDEEGHIFEFSLLEEAVAGNDPFLAKLALQQGNVILFSEKASDLSPAASRPATFSLIKNCWADKVLLYLAEHEGLLDPSKYTEAGRYEMMEFCCVCAILSVAPSPLFLGCTKESSSNFADAYLRAGNKAVHDKAGNNVLVSGLFGSSNASEAGILGVLRRFHEAGADLKILGSATNVRDWTLLHCAAQRGFKDTIDFAITVVGVPVESIAHGTRSPQLGRKITPLGAALDGHQADAALHLVTKYDAKACILGLAANDQAIGRLSPLTEMPEAKLVALVKEMLRRQPDLLDAKFYPPTRAGADGYAGLFGGFMMRGMHGVVESLLNPSNLHVREAVDRLLTTTKVVGSPVQMASVQQDWKMVSILVRAGAKVTTHSKGPLPYGLELKPEMGFLPSCLDMVRRFCTDRAVRMLVEAKAKKENAEGKKGDAASAGTAGAAPPSETFEDPTFKAVLTEKEEKKKAKKRAAKKKAKAKKRAAAKESNAGAGEEPDDSDSDSSGTDEEEKGMDEEERMLARAPTFDLEKEKAARKARAEAAEATETAGKESVTLSV